jgi:hypothetical protein
MLHYDILLVYEEEYFKTKYIIKILAIYVPGQDIQRHTTGD